VEVELGSGAVARLNGLVFICYSCRGDGGLAILLAVLMVEGFNSERYQVLVVQFEALALSISADDGVVVGSLDAQIYPTSRTYEFQPCKSTTGNTFQP